MFVFFFLYKDKKLIYLIVSFTVDQKRKEALDKELASHEQDARNRKKGYFVFIILL